MECGKLTLDTATVSFHLENGVFALKASGVLTRNGMAELMEQLSGYRARCAVIFADYVDAVVAYAPECQWDDYLADRVIGVLIRPDQHAQMLEIARKRAKTGHLRLIFTDASLSSVWVQQQALRHGACFRAGTVQI